MENVNELLTAFTKRLKILDREFRTTEQAAEHARIGCDKARDNAWSQELNGLVSLDQKLYDGIAAPGARLRERVDAIAKEDAEEKLASYDRLMECRILLATAENLGSGVLHVKELEEKQPSADGVSVTLEELLSGKTDLTALMGAVNDAWRGGNTKEAKRLWARLSAIGEQARKLLSGEIDRLMTVLAGSPEALAQRCADAGEQADRELDEAMAESLSALDERCQELTKKSLELWEKNRAEQENYRMIRRERIDRITSSFLNQYPPMEFSEEWERILAAEPDSARCRGTGVMPGALCVGKLEFDTSGMELCADTRSFLRKHYPFLFRNGRLCLRCCLDFGGAANLEFQYGAKQRPMAVKLAEKIALRLFLLLPPGKMTITFVDPTTLGGSFAAFGRMAELETPEGNVIDGKIRVNAAEIEERLTALAGHIADINQRCLQGRYENLMEYNQLSGQPAQGCRVLMLMDYPAGMTEKGLKTLEQIVRFGPKCGVFTLIFRSEEQMKQLPDPVRPAVSAIRAGFRQLKCADEGVMLDMPRLHGRFVFWKDCPAPSREQMDDLIRTMSLYI